jgi:hypothetical protein
MPPLSFNIDAHIELS